MSHRPSYVLIGFFLSMSVALMFHAPSASADVKSEYDDCQALYPQFTSELCNGLKTSTGKFEAPSGEGGKALVGPAKICQEKSDSYFFYGCPKVEAFYKNTNETYRDNLCKAWKALDPSNPEYKRSQEAYRRVECDSREFEKTAAYAKSIAEKCKTYVTVTSPPGSKYDPSCVKAGIPVAGCDSVTEVECASAGAGLGAAGALGTAGVVGPEVEAEKHVKRIEEALDRAKKDPDLKKTTLSEIEKTLIEARGLMKQLKDLTAKEGTKPDYLPRANELVQKLKALADKAEQLAGSSEGSATTITNPLGAGADFPRLIGRVISTFLGMIGAFSLLVFIYAGVLYLTAGGRADQVTKAQDTMKYAFFGIVIILFAYVITNFYFQALLK